MSQLDLARVLRDARPVAPAELRQRVRLVAAQATPPHRRIVTWRRALVVAVPVAAAIAAGVIATRPTHHAAQPTPVVRGAYAGAAQSKALTPEIAVAPNAHRIQRYSTSLELRVRDSAALSDRSKRAIAIAHSLGGYEQRVDVETARANGYADIVLRVPKTHVQQAVRRLTALGTIVSENVQVQDLTPQVNGTDRLIARLQRRLANLRAQPQDTQTERRIAALTTQIEKLQRDRAATVRAARYATVDLQLTTRTPPAPVHHGHGPLHGIGVAFRWIAIGAVSPSPCSRLSPGSRFAPCAAGARTRSSVGLELREDAEGRLADRQLPELRVDARLLLAARLVGRLDLGLAHRQRLPDGTDRAEAGLPALGGAEHVEVDLDVVDLLHAADVRVAPRLVRVDERAAAREARAGVHDLVAVDVAAAALHLLLRVQREGERQLLFHVRHCGSVLYPVQVLTYTPESASDRES
jgi:uncharacterized protein DUF4349